MKNPKRLRRGQALVELVLVLPVLGLMIVVSGELVELLQAKLKFQEATRFVTWEMTSYPLDDFGNANHGHAAQWARARVVSEAKRRYAGMGADNDDASNVAFTAEVASVRTPLGDHLVQARGESLNLMGKGVGWVLGQMGFNSDGWVQVRTSTRLRVGERSRDLKDRLSLIASDWHLSDGADAVAWAGRAGRHRGQSTGAHGLHTQLQRMVTLGVEMPSFDLSRWVPVPPPQGVYVVSKNYKPAEPTDRPCPGIPKYPDAARHGLNSLWEHPGLDADSVHCYDTAPFRDTHAYRDSLYRQMFLARGPYFLGCSNAQADDPTRATGDPLPGDRAPYTGCFSGERP